MKRRILSFILVVAMVVGYVPMSVWADGETGIEIVVPEDTIAYSEGQGPETVLNEISMTVEVDTNNEEKILFAGGNFNVDIEDRRSYETLDLPDGIYEDKDATGNIIQTIKVEDGEIFIVHSEDNLEPIGRVNSNYDGKLDSEGKPLPLRVDFSTPLPNGDFSDKDDNGLPKDWEINIKKTKTSDWNLNQIELGTLAKKTQENKIKTSKVGDLFKVERDIQEGQAGYYYFHTDFNYGQTPSKGSNSNAWQYEGKERKLTTNGTITTKVQSGGSGKDYLELGLKGGKITSNTNSQKYTSVFGPEAISDVFEASAGDKIVFDWMAYMDPSNIDDYDDYEIYGFIIKLGEDDSYKDDDHIEILYGRGKVKNWDTSSFVIEESGKYKFRFVAGSYNNTGGNALGATLYIRDIRLFKKAVDSKLVEFIAKNITYTNTKVSELARELIAKEGGLATRTVVIEAKDLTHAETTARVGTKAEVLIELNKPPKIEIEDDDAETDPVTGEIIIKKETNNKTKIEGTLAARDPEVEENEEDNLTYAIITIENEEIKENGTIATENGGIATVNDKGEWSYKPKNNFLGEDEFTIRVIDKDKGWTDVVIKITVKGVVEFRKENGDIIKTEGLVKGEAIGDKLQTAPEKPGYTFVGWKDQGGNWVDEDTIINENKVLYPHYTIEDYKVILIDGDTTDELPASHGSSLNLPRPTKDGYVFKGWNTEEDGGGTRFTSSTRITSNTTLYAQWEKTGEDEDMGEVIIGGTTEGSVNKEELTYVLRQPGPVKGSVTVDDKTGEWTYTPNEGETGEDEFIIDVKYKDGKLVEEIPIKVVIIGPTTNTTDKNTETSGVVTPNDSEKSYEIGKEPTNGTATVDEDGNWTYTPTDEESVGEDDFTINVIEDGIVIEEITVKVTITKEDSEITGSIGEGEIEKAFRRKQNTGPANGVATVDKDTGEWTYKPNANFTGEDEFIIEVIENGRVVKEIPVRILVKDPNATEIKTGETGSGKSEEININYQIGQQAKKGSAEVDENTGRWTYEPGSEFVDKDDFTILVKKDGIIIEEIRMEINVRENLDIEILASPKNIVANGKDISTLTAMIVNKDNDKPVGAGIWVEFTTEDGSFIGDGDISPDGKKIKVQTDENGEAKAILKSAEINDTNTHTIPVTATVKDFERGLYGSEEIEMKFEPSSISGILTDKNGKPIEGARVRLTGILEGEKYTSEEFITDKDGKYKIAVPYGNVQYEVEITKRIEGINEEIIYKQTAKAEETTGTGEDFPATKTLTGVLLSKDKDGNTRNIGKNNSGNIEIRSIDNEKTGTINSETGVFTVEDLPVGSHEFIIIEKVKDKNGNDVELIMSKMIVTIDEDGEVAIHEELIDPYGTIRDLSTGKVLGDVHVQLYYADTLRNKVNGKTPGSPVPLPELPGFAPNDNKNGQYSTWNQVFNNHPDVMNHGNYAWMVFPESDYYIIATKPGYQDYRSPIISVEYDVVKHDFSMIPTISDSGGSGDGLYYPPYIPSTPKEEPKKPTNNTPANIPTEITTDQRNYLEGTEGKIEIGYINKGGEVTGGKLVVSLPKDAEVIYLDGGKIVGDTVVWDLGQIKPGQEGRKNPIFKFPRISSSEETLYLKVQILEDGLGIGQGSFIEIRIFSNRYGNGKHSRYIVGHPDGEFKPDKSITRAEIAVIFARILELEDYVKNETIYTDVKPSDWYGRGVEAASRKGLFEGYDNGEFRPNAPITRAELATVIARFLELQNTPPLEEVFKDIEGHWASNYIAELYRNNVVNGYADGLFKPQDEVKRSEAVTMFNRMLNRGPLKEVEASFPDVSLDHWANGDVEESTRFHYYFRNEDASETHIETYFEELKF